MLNKNETGQILIIKDPNEFIQIIAEMQAQYIARHKNGVAKQ